jgi:glycosyltransferase involved in cell wall biosynthesis
MADVHLAQEAAAATTVAPVSAIIPTRNRAAVLARTLASLAQQSALPAELIVVDASSDEGSRAVVDAFSVDGPACKTIWQRARVTGAAAQRNQAVALATQPLIAFFDDDILFEPHCLARLLQALHDDPGLGGVNAMITNQCYQPPGLVSRTVFRLLAGCRLDSYAGRVLGPAVNLLPEDDARLPDVVPVEWLNLGATVYRRDLLPDPPFEAFFTGYSLGEDLTLSWRVGQRARLANVRSARIFHDTQPGDYKADRVALTRMALVNRHHIMTAVLGRRRLADHAKLLLWESFQLANAAVVHRLGRPLWQMLGGELLGAGDIVFRR